ncbi:MAG TPA: AI-2E family transporter [Bacteroidales bacterium]|nr:AI-2E family transporter [Bacteroidales bacterium]HPF03597.1 AI-2E family transporter [Bacteroidales bacterium]HPJ59569.1 AI-2E family transporter [Bacteroidales bacterium]HPR12970.1 AI-2E family transporter [Bacteroidales bacterium]HRW84690.1 AI-2E family transporter [Bacteroidales bacterium]
MKVTWRSILVFIAVVLLLALAWFYRNIVVYVLVAGVFSIVGRPLVDLLSKLRIRRWKFPRALAALITLAVILGFIALFFAIFVPLITRQVNYLSTIDSEKVVQLIKGPIEKAENIIRSLNRELVEELSLWDYFNQKVSEILNIEVIQNFLGSALGTVGTILVSLFSISFITFFSLKDQHLFFESILMWVPDKYIDNFTRALYSIKNLLTRYFIGVMIQSTCIMILVTTGMTLVGIDFQQALVMGLIVGVLNIIPYVGPWLGFFIAVTMGIASHINYDFATVVSPLIFFMVIVIFVVQLIDNVVFQPVIFSNSVRAHPLEIFIVVLAAGFAAGVPGMILGIPAYTVLRVFAREFFYNFKPVQKITSGLTPENIGTTIAMNNDEDVPDEITRKAVRKIRKPHKFKQ